MTIAIKPDFARTARIDSNEAERMRAAASSDPESFWREHGRRVAWIKPYTQISDTSFDANDFRIRWFVDGTLNASVSCLDRHIEERGDQTAIVWEGDDPSHSKCITYKELHAETCRLANALTGLGVRKGDRVCIYMPMIIEAAVAMLACARIGAIHAVVFGGFAPQALAGRIDDCGASIVLTADEGRRGGKIVPLKRNVDVALSKVDSVRHVLVVKHTGADVPMQPGRDLWLHAAVAESSSTHEPVEMNAEDPLFILYTSGSTGKPKGVVHTTGGYLVYASMTHEYVFDHRPGDVYWCTADVGWITGHSYVVYGPLANGATTVMFEGVPSYPDCSRLWQVVDKHGVTILYTAPTAIRALMREGDAPVKQTSRRTLRLLGSVGEPINPEAWLWYYRVVGEERCPVVDTWWQTETGGIMITALPGATTLKPGSAATSFFGVRASVIDASGQPIEGPGEGHLCLDASWPGQSRTIHGDHQRFIDTYFSTYPGRYFTGDGCRRDEDGYYWITGRVDDVINVAGHRLGTAEIESSLVGHPAVAEAAVVAFPHVVKGQGVYAYVTLKAGIAASAQLHAEVIEWVGRDISPIARPDRLQWAPNLPKTRSGKIMRRILRKIAENELEFGDVSTLADPSVVEELVAGRIV